jgi:putative DNA primase/helicase
MPITRDGDGSIKVKQAIERIEHLLVTNEFSDRVYDLRDGDTCSDHLTTAA